MSDSNPEAGAPAKPAILQESVFVVEEPWPYKLARTLSIWLNKLFFSSLVLLIVWLFMASAQGDTACAPGLGQSGANATDDLDIVADGTCSVFLTPTAKFLGGAAIISFVLSIAFGGIGLMVGKNIFETTRTEDEAGSEETAKRQE